MEKWWFSPEGGFNAARSIVCVETLSGIFAPQLAPSFNAARSIVCVETEKRDSYEKSF